MKLMTILLLSTFGYSAYSQTNEVQKITVTGDRVSLRAKPDVNSELLERAMLGEELILLDRTNGWIAVQAPESMDLWVSGDYLQNGRVVPAKLNVRSGPSQNYSVVCVVKQGDSLTQRGEFSDWLKIAPPPGSRVWISEDYVELIVPPAPEPEPEPAVVAGPDMTQEPVPAPVTPAPSERELKPLILVLDKSKEQGVYDEIPGVLRRANPGLYKLVLIVDDMEEPICLVRGKAEQMERYLNRAMLIKGKKFWAKDIDLPILQPIKIHLDPILKD
jgi:hypothetical protein